MRYMRLLCRLKSGNAEIIVPPLAVQISAMHKKLFAVNRSENGYKNKRKEVLYYGKIAV
jgi:hypothetical protein